MSLRERVLSGLESLIASGKVKIGEPDADSVVVVTRAAGYDIKRDREVWHAWENQNEVRDLNCSKCGHQVVMSNGMFARLQKGQIKPQQVQCGQCALGL